MAGNISNYSIRNLSTVYFSSHYHSVLPIWMSRVLSSSLPKNSINRNGSTRNSLLEVVYCLLEVLENVTGNCPQYCRTRNSGDPARAVGVSVVSLVFFGTRHSSYTLTCNLQNLTENTNIKYSIFFQFETCQYNH